eukprot:CAMPEP_0184358960 /NCGR_PEP_ID=MMETSP1089-20130417/117598_1 /TAXON_ID=38269 ORGANISM="Gloeochaete wittrockiana, Strain SAG46.84" /NCGR_SAMPLE_ID=MMETSP1089 /ASSEMBLY_ACC=CAM_ASM_000445 /LENGTH=457 /DNA_ID=CAMNT_0026697547 /DNA_START=16 /DNA_END=1389 /DNA_ORIENTATION=-
MATMKFSVELWDKFEEVYKHASNGKGFCKGLSDFYTKRAAIEREYAKKLQALCKSTERDYGSLNISWIGIKDEVDNIAKKHLEFAESVALQVAEPVNNFLRDTRKNRSTLKEQGRKLIKDLAAAKSRTTAAKQEYDLSCKKKDDTKLEFDRANANNQQSPQIEKIAKRLKADDKKASLAQKKYQDTVEVFRSMQDAYYDREMPKVLEEFQRMEEQRVERVRSVIATFIELQRSVAPEINSSCDRMNISYLQNNPRQDIDAFIQEHRSGEALPERCEYEPYGSEPRPSKPLASSSSSISSSSGAYSAPMSSSGGAPLHDSGSRAAAAAPPAARGVGKCRGLYDYQSSDPNELSFSKGDIITIIQKDPSGWWHGELNGTFGVFPSVDWVEEIHEGARSAPAPNVARCKALYDYVAENEYEVSIKAGDTLTVEGEEEGWYVGTSPSGQFGRFPSNYVKML